MSSRRVADVVTLARETVLDPTSPDLDTFAAFLVLACDVPVSDVLAIDARLAETRWVDLSGESHVG